MSKFVSCLMLAVVAFASAGCLSRTKVTLGPVGVGGQTQAHEMRAPSLTLTPHKIGFTLGPVSAYIQSEITDSKVVIGVQSVTGETSEVECGGVAKFK